MSDPEKDAGSPTDWTNEKLLSELLSRNAKEDNLRRSAELEALNKYPIAARGQEEDEDRKKQRNAYKKRVLGKKAKNALLGLDTSKDLLDLSISGLLACNIDPRLTTWLAMRLERLLRDEEAPELFDLKKPAHRLSGRRGKREHGEPIQKGFTAREIAAAVALCRRRVERLETAYEMVAQAVQLEDTKDIAKIWRQFRYKDKEKGINVNGLDYLSEDDLVAMSSPNLLALIE